MKFFLDIEPIGLARVRDLGSAILIWLVCALAVGPTRGEPTGEPTRPIKIAVENLSSLVTRPELVRALAAIQIQLDRDFYPIWGLTAELRVAGPDPVPEDAWRAVILDEADLAGYTGYHWIDASGKPTMKVFVATAQRHGMRWTVTLSHEILETLANPYANRVVLSGSRLYPLEVCDPCGIDRYAYCLGGVQVCNFVYPSWFQAWSQGPKFDHQGYITKPLQVLPQAQAIVHTLNYEIQWRRQNSD